VSRIHGQNLPINRLRVRQSPGPVMLEGEVKGLGNGHVSIVYLG